MIKPHSAFIDADTIRLHYLEWNLALIRETQPLLAKEQQEDSEEDGVPLVLLHGLGASADTWRLLAEHLYNQYLLIAFDLRGHGQSDHPESGYDLETVAEDVIRGMAELGLGQVALVGHGWGARVALVLAAKHPALISHLVLVDCPLVEPRHWPGMTRERFIRDKALADTYNSWENYIQAMYAEMSPFWSPKIEEIVSAYVRRLPDGRVEERLRPDQQRQIRESLWEDRALSYYSKLACPVLLIPAAAEPQPGDELPERLENADEFASAKGYMAAQVARAIQRCKVHWMTDTSHDIQLQRPQALADLIATFIRT
jgi:pimeloyl-ACP methyl ester carboxylesterase